MNVVNIAVMLATFRCWRFYTDLKEIRCCVLTRNFCCVCTILTGTGKSKKLAKRQAAHKMWEKLQDSPITASNVTPGLDEDDEVRARIRIEPLAWCA
jgi:hypothetical protein